jgi:hypothetical protein
MYADDSLGFSNKPIDYKVPMNTGIEIHPEKSGIIKEYGI